MPDFIFYPITSLMYAALAAYFWRTRWTADAAPAPRLPASRVMEHVLVLIPVTLHGALLYQTVFAGDGVRLGIGNSISMIVWLTVRVGIVSAPATTTAARRSAPKH